jgi:hypothetical protein
VLGVRISLGTLEIDRPHDRSATRLAEKQYRIFATNTNCSRILLYGWQKQFFEKGAAVFAAENKNSKKIEEQRTHQLEKKSHRKHEVLSELLEEHILESKYL